MLARNRGRAGATSNPGRKASPLPADLQEAVTDLDECRDEAREEGYPVPSDIAFSNARLLLPKFYAIAPVRFEVYPTPDADIVIDYVDDHGHTLTTCLESKGSVYCMTRSEGRRLTRLYPNADGLPDAFITDALEALVPRER